MKETYYWHKNTVIVNYTSARMTNARQLVESEGFDVFLDAYLDYLYDHNRNLYNFLFKDHDGKDDVKKDVKSVIDLLLMMNFGDTDIPYMELPHVFLDIIENGYNFWRSLERYSILYVTNPTPSQVKSFLDSDGEVNAIALDFYRTLQQKVQGTDENVYRQLQAGTNAAVLLENYKWDCPNKYKELEDIAFVHTIMMRTPLLLHPDSNKRTNIFADQDHNPIEDFKKGDDEWFCYPAKVGSLLIYAYFHRNHMTSCVATANLFHLAKPEECKGQKPDAILLFGNDDGRNDTTFYYDEENDIWVGKVSEAPEIDYFGYTKKSILTLHNLVMIKRGWLPIHGAMVNIYLKDGTKKGLMFMGDSGAGKSETLEALNVVAKDLIDHQETIFDDMGTLHLDEQGQIKGQGTEIGAFVRLDDLDKGTAYRDMDRSIFFNPEKPNARVVLPAAPYDVVVTDQTVDCFLYANNYTDKRGMHLFNSKEEAEPVFIEGKRQALGTTQEKGLSTTFFANPFGPMQRQEECQVLIDKMFDALFEQNIPVGEIYTCLGLPDKGDNGINKAAEALLNFVKTGEAVTTDE